MNIDITIADYQNPQHQSFIAELMNLYALDPMGGGEGLPDEISQRIASELDKVPNAFTVLAIVNDKAIGLINCMQGFSTFKCKPLINIHDVVVTDSCRGQGVSQKMMAKVEQIARQRNCGKLTLEVLEGNTPAQASYRKSGFDGYELDPEMGKALFWQKVLG